MAVEIHGDADQIGFAIVGLVIITVAKAELLACPEHMIEQLRRMGYEPGPLEQTEISFLISNTAKIVHLVDSSCTLVDPCSIWTVPKSLRFAPLWLQ